MKAMGMAHIKIDRYMIYLLTAVGLTPGGSSTVYIYAQTIHRKTQLIWEECGPLEAEVRSRSIAILIFNLVCSSGGCSAP